MCSVQCAVAEDLQACEEVAGPPVPGGGPLQPGLAKLVLDLVRVRVRVRVRIKVRVRAGPGPLRSRT